MTLSHFIRESKLNENNIIEGYQFSGKKNLLYEILNNLDSSFSIVHHKNIISYGEHGNELKEIENIPGIKAYEIEGFDKVTYKIEGDIVFLFLPSKMFIDNETKNIKLE